MLMASQQGLVVMLMLLQQVIHNADDVVATG